MKKIFTLFVGTIISVGAFAQWDTLVTGTNTNFNSIDFADATNGVAVGNDPTTTNGNVFYTADGGTTWSLVENGSNGKNDVSFSSPMRGWIACDNGIWIKTNSSGQNWSYGGQIGTRNFNCVFFPNDTVGYLAGENGILYRTNNSGGTWDTLNSGTLLSINDIFFTDPANGWIVGDGGYIAATADSGNSWTQISQPFFGFMNVQGFAYNASFANAVTVGNYGDALFSSNSGMNWSSFSSGVTTTLNKVAFANDLAGVIVGNNGIILRTENGGTTWMRDSVPGVTENLTGICWATDTIAYICGDDGRVLKSNMDISSVNSPLVNPMNASAFPNPCSDELNIVLNLESSSSVQIQITDVAGRIVLMENEGENFIGATIFHVSGISSLTTGMYFVRVITENGVVTLPVVKR